MLSSSFLSIKCLCFLSGLARVLTLPWNVYWYQEPETVPPSLDSLLTACFSFFPTFLFVILPSSVSFLLESTSSPLIEVSACLCIIVPNNTQSVHVHLVAHSFVVIAQFWDYFLPKWVCFRAPYSWIGTQFESLNIWFSDKISCACVCPENPRTS